MPRVAEAVNTVGIASPGVSARVDAPNMGAGGEMIGRALQGLGNAGADFADTMMQIQSAQDNAAAKEATNSVNARVNDLLYTGEDPYFQKSGKGALEARPTTDKGITDAITEARKGLGSPHQQKLFDQALADQRRSWGAQIANHAFKEAFSYDDEQSAARADQAHENAVVNYLDPVESRAQLDTGIAEIHHRGDINHWSPEKTQIDALKFTNEAHKDVGEQLAYSGGQDGPKLAIAYADRHRGELTGDGYDSILTHARVQQNALEAEQRRQATEQRRIEREAKTDARDRAQSVYRNIQDHVVVDPKALAGAIGDAKTAGDDALAEGLRQGGLKNNLTQQYAGATPAELQQRVNELSADITKAGGKVDPDKMVERDTLSELLTKSRSELNRDALSWGAAHLGISVEKLNLNDPASIAARLDAVTKIASRTGTTAQPLMQDEVAASQQTLYHGSTQDKVGLAMRIARLGPLALPAAEQLSNNPGWQNLIGLATHANHGVAASRVNQVLTGQDVLKTKPKLIDQSAATRQFQQFVGGSLQFLPRVSAGVYANAQALLASQANEHGWNEWTDAQGGWQSSVNSALGAYTKNGKKYGGLATFNGGVTILPENMAQDEFEGRIAKSNGPEFRKAQNGIPVFGDGRTPTATDLKKMQWVPSGDGIYRLSDGNGFLKTKQGGFYEVDVARMHPQEGGAPRPFGMISPGNIDIHHRPVVHNRDGSISTVRSISVGTDDGEVLIPTIVRGKVVSNEAAIRHYKRTGEHLGIFRNAKAADAFAQTLHEQQAQEYGSSISPANLAHYGYTRH